MICYMRLSEVSTTMMRDHAFLTLYRITFTSLIYGNHAMNWTKYAKRIGNARSPPTECHAMHHEPLLGRPTI